jgi:hypothetical protein
MKRARGAQAEWTFAKYGDWLANAPDMVPDGHIDTAVDEELHRLVVRMKDQLVQNARRLMGAPRGVSIFGRPSIST